MAILDIQIVSASLAEIQAGLGAGSNEITWVQTSYLIAEVVMIPLSGFLSRALGTRILFRRGGRFYGGEHDVRTVDLPGGDDRLAGDARLHRRGDDPDRVRHRLYRVSAHRMGLVAPLIGLVATLAPTIGPTVGGILTERSLGTGCSSSTSSPASA